MEAVNRLLKQREEPLLIAPRREVWKGLGNELWADPPGFVMELLDCSKIREKIILSRFELAFALEYEHVIYMNGQAIQTL